MLDLVLPNRTVVLLAGFAAVGVGGIAAVSPKLAVAAVLGLGVMAATLSRPLLGIAVFIVITLPENLPSSFGVATLAKPLGLLITFAWILSLIADRGRHVPFLPRDQPLVAAAAVGYTAWAISSAVWATESGTALSNALRLVQVVVLVLVVYSAVRSKRDLRLLAQSFLVGAALTAAYSLASGRYTEGRITGGIVNPNYLASMIVVAIVLAGFMFAGETRARNRLVLLLFMAVYAVAFVQTQSRGGIIGLIAALVAAVIVGGPVRARVIATVCVIAGIGISYYAILAPQSLRDRVTNVSAQGSAGRSDEWTVALHMGEDHPVVGVGLANYPIVSPTYSASSINLRSSRYALQQFVTHNTYLETFAELGAVGLVLLLATLLLCFVGALRGVRALARPADFATSLISRGLIAGTFGVLVAFTFGSGEYDKQLWLLLGLLCTVPSAAGVFRGNATEGSDALFRAQVSSGNPALESRR